MPVLSQVRIVQPTIFIGESAKSPKLARQSCRRMLSSCYYSHWMHLLMSCGRIYTYLGCGRRHIYKERTGVLCSWLGQSLPPCSGNGMVLACLIQAPVATLRPEGCWGK